MRFHLRPNPKLFGFLEWDGQYPTLPSTKGFLRYKINGAVAKEVGRVQFDSGFSQYWILGNALVGTNERGGEVYFYNYPQGGNPTNTITGLKNPYGITISVAPSGSDTR
ncbi:MAG: hypothetical protein WCB99_16030 [Candidatus Cybelea sp.]|jgi:hypothetical protein